MCGGGESELGLVMLAYTVLFLFSANTLFLNCCDLMLFLLVLDLCMYVYLFTGITPPLPVRLCKIPCFADYHNN